VSSQEHLNKVREVLFDTYLPEIRLAEFFLVDVDAVVDEFEQKVGEGKVDAMDIPDGEIKIIQVRKL
jgi:hypothetical protein